MPREKFGQTFAKPKTKRSWVEARAKVEREARCRHCGRTDQELDAAHVIPRSLGGDQSPDAIVPLCRNCHTQYDSHDLDLSSSLTLDELFHASKLRGSVYSALRRIDSPYWKRLDRAETRSQRLTEALEDICAGNYLETDSDVDPLFPERAIAERALNDRTGDPLPW